MAFAGVSLIVDGKLCHSTSSPVDAGADSGYHLLVVRGYSRSRETSLPDGDCILSSPFIVGGHRWNLEFHPAVYDDTEKDEFISVFLILDPSVSESVEAQFVFSFVDQPELRASVRNHRPQRFDKRDNGHGEERFARREVLERSRHVKNDSFTIRCDVVVVKADANTGVQRAAGTIQSHFGHLLLTEEGSDITFEVDGEQFNAHRCVLAARSAVFKARLSGDMDEGATAARVVKINDVKADVFGGLLAFIYTGAMPDFKVDSMEEDKVKEEEGKTAWLLQLLEAADQYDLRRLNAICEEVLALRHIRATTLADIIAVPERRRCSWLKEECLEFMKSHTDLSSVFTPGGLEKIISNCSPAVLKELISKFAS